MNTSDTSSTLVLSCGLLVQSPAGWLLAHTTKTPRWDVPKGRIEPGETPLAAALRETQEETGLALHAFADRMVDLGRHRYIKKKDLHLFKLWVPAPLDLSGCACSTHVVRHGRQYPEIDAWAWVPASRVSEKIGKGLRAYLEALSLLPGSGNKPNEDNIERAMRLANA